MVSVFFFSFFFFIYAAVCMTESSMLTGFGRILPSTLALVLCALEVVEWAK